MCTDQKKCVQKMEIKHSISFFLQKVYSRTGNGEGQIRLRVRWNGNTYQANSGYTIQPERWENGRCKRNAFNSRGVSASDINRQLAALEGIVEDIFKAFEVADTVPSLDVFKAEFAKRTGKGGHVKDCGSFEKALLDFVVSQERTHSWAPGTVVKFGTLRRHIRSMRGEMRMKDFNKKFYEEYITYLLRRGLKNTYIMKFWKILTWFLRWADKNGLLDDKSYLDFTPRLKTVRDKEVVYLTWDELMKVYGFEFPRGKEYLARVRDVFCFQCFTSLRYSDVAKLKRSDIIDGVIKVVTKKTGDTISIELNKYSSAILEKYKDEEKPLPVVSNQRMNVWLKEVCYVAGIDTPVTEVYYRGSERVEETRPKYECVASHTGRRTFICNALTMGIPPSLVMEWTGHSDYKAMKPYIKIADKEKARAMKLFDER